MTDTRSVNLPSVFHLKNTSLCSDVFGKHPRSSSLLPPRRQREQIKCDTTSGPLAAAVLLRETPLPGAVRQRQQHEQDAAHDEDGPRAADARHRPGELVVERNRVVAGQEGHDGLVEHHQTEKHHDTCGGVTQVDVMWSVEQICSWSCLYWPDRIKQKDAGLRKKMISLLRDMVMQMAPITIRNRLNRANMAAATFRSAHRKKTS